MDDKAIRAAKLTLGGMLEKRRAKSAVERAQGQIAPSKYLPGVPRQVHADGGNVDDPQPAAPPPADLGQAREQKQLRTFHSGLMGDIRSSVSAAQEAHQKALDAGVFDGYEVGDVLQGSAHPMRITGRYVQKWKPTKFSLQSFDRMGVKPTIIEHEGQQYIPMLRYQTGKEGVDGFQEGSAYLDGVKAAGYRKMGGLRAVKADGGGISDPRAAFMQGNHPDVPEALYHGNALKIATKGWTDEIDPEQTQRNMAAQDFRTFKPSEHGNYGPGIYLSDSPKTASDYAQGIRASQKEEMPYGQVMKLHVSMKQPFTDDALRHPGWIDYIKREIKQGLWLGGISAEDRKNAADLVAKLDNGTARVRDLFLTDTPEGTMVNQFGQHNIHKTIRNSGFDGIIAHRPDGTKEYVAFKPEQVKSAIGNQGTFDPTNPDMTKAEGGRIHANKGGKMGARSDFVSGNHPEVPPVVYHSTKSDFHDFRPMSHFGTMQAAHDRYSPDQNLSEGMSVIPAHISLKNPVVLGKEWGWQNSQQMIRQVADAMFKSDRDDKHYIETTGKLYDLAHNPFIKMPELEQKAADLLREVGHDGIIYTNTIEDPGSRSFVTLGPEQVKSSIGNQGTFDPTHPDMTKKDGGEVDGDDDGIDAFHSSPHDFDQFDIAHLGTGEGAQAYGHGLYFSANPKVSDRGGQYWNQFMNKMKSGAERSAAATLKGQKWDRDAAVSQLRSNAEYHEDRGSGRYGDGSDVEEGHRLLAQEYRDAADHIASGKIAGPRTYRVKLNIKPHELIDWDKPLSEQHPNVQAVLGTGSETAGSKLGRANSNPMHAGDIVGKDRATRQELSEHLLSKGIKGIRYLDAGSRDMSDGDPTYNYVTFNHDLVKVVDKYKDGGDVDGDDGIDAYHGSPHDFDEFDIGKLGTGEGQQAYGHGLYFAGNEGIAKYYRDTLRSELPLVHIDGKNTGKRISESDYHVQNMIRNFMTPEQYHEHLLNSPNYASLQKAYADASDVDEGLGVTDKDVARWEIEDFHKKLDEIKGYFGKKVSAFVPSGHMYKVKLNAKPHELLDWDAPLSEQPEVARKLGYADPEEIKRQKDFHYSKFKPSSGTSFEDLFGPLAPEENEAAEALSKMPQDWGNMTGKSLHDRLVAHTGSKKGAADAMQAAGLKGIKYRDAGSRDLSDGDPTHNYVMFHHDPVKVMKKYEYGGTVGKSGGGSMGDDGKPVDLGAARAMRNFNQNSTGPTPEAEGVFNRLAAARDAAADAHEAAIKDGAFNSAQIGDVFKYKPLDTYAPMKVVDHGMVPVERWGGINPPKYVYKDHFPVAEVQYQDASKERRKFPIELLEDRDRYDFLSGKPRIARADGGRLNLYSKAARIIAGMKDQPMQAADIVKYALGKGAKKTEMAHVDVPPGKATPKQVADHIEFMQPQIGVHRRETFYRYNDPERYERQINYLEGQGRYDEAEELNREYEAFSGFGGKDAPLYAKYQLPGGENYREHVLTLDNHPDDQTYMAKQHWGRMKNPLVHVRMSDRIINGKKILHIEELQSDWNNDARKEGFRTGREKSDYDAYVAKMRQDAIAGIDRTASPMIRRALEQKYSAMDPYMLAMKMGVQGEHNQLANAAFMGDKKPPQAPYINPDRDDASEVGLKHILMEAAKGGYHGIAFTPDEAQEARWPGHTFKGIYNRKLPGMAQTLVQQHDRDTAADQIGLPGTNAASQMIPLSDKARDSIMQNGFSSFKRGGAVGYGDGGSVEPDIKNPMSIFPKPQRMFPEDQRPAGGQYLSMPSKADVTGHKAEAATIGVAPGGKPFFRASQNAVDQTGSPGRGSATTKTNLFKQKAGWKWQEAPEGHENTDTIVSVEHRGRHFYALNAHFPKGVDLARYENATSEPRLRPTTQGNVELGPQAGSISVRGKSHPVYHHVIVKADGGAVDAALAATRRFTKDGQHVTMRLKD